VESISNEHIGIKYYPVPQPSTFRLKEKQQSVEKGTVLSTYLGGQLRGFALPYYDDLNWGLHPGSVGQRAYEKTNAMEVNKCLTLLRNVSMSKETLGAVADKTGNVNEEADLKAQYDTNEESSASGNDTGRSGQPCKASERSKLIARAS
jgi:hypothetical protein